MPIIDLRRNTSNALTAVREGGPIYTTQHGRPAAVLVAYEQYEALLAQVDDYRVVYQIDDTEQIVTIVRVNEV